MIQLSSKMKTHNSVMMSSLRIKILKIDKFADKGRLRRTQSVRLPCSASKRTRSLSLNIIECDINMYNLVNIKANIIDLYHTQYGNNATYQMDGGLQFKCKMQYEMKNIEFLKDSVITRSNQKRIRTIQMG